MLIQRPADLPGVIHRHGADRLPRNAELLVPEGQCAVFTRDGVVVGMLATGHYQLAPESIPFLGQLVEPGGATIAATIFFVPIDPVAGLEVRARLGRVTGPSAPAFGLAMRTLVTVRTDDPFRLGHLLASMPPDQTVEEVIESMLAPRLGALVSGMASSGEVPIGTVGGAALGAVKEALESGALALDEVGIHVVDVTALELRPDRSADVPVRPPDGIRWGLEGIPFREAGSGIAIPVAAHGSFEGDPVPDHLHDWVRGLIAEALHSSAAIYSGSVRELPTRVGEWSEWLTQRVSPAVEQQTGARGRVTVGGVGLPTS
jgi:hypothetical protein